MNPVHARPPLRATWGKRLSSRFVEVVESRRLFAHPPITPPDATPGGVLQADRVLIILGSDADGTVSITAPDGNTVKVAFNGTVSTLDRRDPAVDEVIAELGEGDNTTFTNSADFRDGVSVSSSVGNDSVSVNVGGYKTDSTGRVIDDPGPDPGPGGSNTVDPGNDNATVHSVNGRAGDVLTVNGNGGGTDARNYITVDAADASGVHATLTGLYGHFTTGTGDDTIDLSNATPGNDSVYVSTAQGDDSVIGSAAADIIYPGSGNDTVRGGAGDDTVLAESSNDVLASIEHRVTQF